jgi:hypothetical protein
MTMKMIMTEMTMSKVKCYVKRLLLGDIWTTSHVAASLEVAGGDDDDDDAKSDERMCKLQMLSVAVDERVMMMVIRKVAYCSLHAFTSMSSF